MNCGLLLGNTFFKAKMEFAQRVAPIQTSLPTQYFLKSMDFWTKISAPACGMNLRFSVNAFARLFEFFKLRPKKNSVKLILCLLIPLYCNIAFN